MNAHFKLMNDTLIILACFAVMFLFGRATAPNDYDKIQELQIRCHFLEGYKDAYMNHIDKCDTLHSKCFKLGE